MFNVSDLLSVSSTVFSGVESQTKETLMVMLPIVGITVVIFSLALLAIVLAQFSRIEKFSNFKENFFSGKSGLKNREEAKKEKEEKKEDQADSQVNVTEDEITAISIGLHLFIQDSSSDPVILTEHPVENSGWTSSARTRQNSTFNKWQSSKKR